MVHVEQLIIFIIITNNYVVIQDGYISKVLVTVVITILLRVKNTELKKIKLIN